jgi:TolB-like protein
LASCSARDTKVNVKKVKFSRPQSGWTFVWLLLPVLICSCAFKDQPLVMKSDDLPFGGEICQIAVLPFTNQTGYKLAETIFTRVFTAELITTGNYIVAQEGDVRRILNQMRVMPGEELSSEQLRALADRLGVQIVISGAVLEMQDKVEGGRRLEPSLAVIIRIMEASSGRTMWATYHRAEGSDYQVIMHFGMVNTVSALAKRVSAEILHLWVAEGFKKCIK